MPQDFRLSGFILWPLFMSTMTWDESHAWLVTRGRWLPLRQRQQQWRWGQEHVRQAHVELFGGPILSRTRQGARPESAWS
mmetsp:Transcript_125856/g.402884  ORF Transcript_125856/g.402884 Transcript_125856/m.402884 type:complete len:80 (-) Transcript_125856:38-277(-)